MCADKLQRWIERWKCCVVDNRQRWTERAVAGEWFVTITQSDRSQIVFLWFVLHMDQLHQCHATLAPTVTITQFCELKGQLLKFNIAIANLQ